MSLDELQLLSVRFAFYARLAANGAIYYTDELVDPQQAIVVILEFTSKMKAIYHARDVWEFVDEQGWEIAGPNDVLYKFAQRCLVEFHEIGMASAQFLQDRASCLTIDDVLFEMDEKFLTDVRTLLGIDVKERPSQHFLTRPRLDPPDVPIKITWSAEEAARQLRRPNCYSQLILSELMN